MTTERLSAHFANASSLTDLAQRLGRTCVIEQQALKEAEHEPGVASHVSYLQSLVREINPAKWTAHDPAGGFSHLLDARLEEVAERLFAFAPLDCLAALRGLCDRALLYFYESTVGQVHVDLGTPLPVAVRPMKGHYSTPMTPMPGLSRNRSPLCQEGWYCYEHRAGESLSLVLDFAHRDRLDELNWVATPGSPGRLPRIATLHLPMGADDRKAEVFPDGRFFDVAPVRWQPAEVLAQLEGLAGAEIAVLPELCLPSPDALEDALAAVPGCYPPLVVAGSAHARVHDDGRELRVNESHVYLDGRRVSAHRKIRALETAKLGDRHYDVPLVEDITDEPKQIVVLSGGHTRLAVAICADLNEKRVLSVLESAGVNLLLVPAFSYGMGMFNAAACDISGRCQGVCVVANADLEPSISRPGREGSQGTTADPFHVIAAVPLAAPGEQSGTYRYRGESRPPRGVLDPNKPLEDGAMEWQ